ncbi:uncharacterized protein LACBIDRAFT_327680 [Laccaria bicolor S238N-H82]|uniref:Predicted protein n=1 Tax=Laccaria bicolor (strain S238N-H82 / ATCC MYA-4686) TaxID=486041 RepID=B0DCH9_LACBS|nr:uncharacterized protein LACBIDRAFT_327680 [Laccaria bicolor S238N-H82]EDR07732.1 predicted protein [Laccaria bicolor S238N-H82]|eukprot:XP_001881521.1 predicted protein [Laccaria bicolor S238N-H82]
MAQDHVDVGTVRNLNLEDDIKTPEQLPSTSSWILANMGGRCWRGVATRWKKGTEGTEKREGRYGGECLFKLVRISSKSTTSHQTRPPSQDVSKLESGWATPWYRISENGKAGVLVLNGHAMVSEAGKP